MKKQLILIIGLLIFLLINDIRATESKKVLLFEIDTLFGTSLKDAQLLTDGLAQAIGRIGAYEVYPKSLKELTSILEDHMEAIPSRWDESSMRKIGTWLDCDYVVTGNLRKTESKRYSISLQLYDVNYNEVVSTAVLDVLDYNHRLLFTRLAQLLFWGRLRIVCNIPQHEVVLDGKKLQEESKDPDHDFWLVQPEIKHTLEVKTKKENYTEYQQEIVLRVAESRVVDAKLKYRMGTLEVKSSPKAKVYLNGEKIGKTNLKKEILEGEYTLTLKARRHKTIEKILTISPEESISINEILPVNYSSYKRNGIISIVATVVFIGGGLYASYEADKAYDQYLETMDTNKMKEYRHNAITLDYVSYASYGVAGACALWSALEWIGLIKAHKLSSQPMKASNNRQFNFSISEKGINLKFQIY